MSKKAVIDCDYEPCDRRETFPPELPPPRNWYIVTHPAVRGPAPVRGVSTFCSSGHLALWAKTRDANTSGVDHVG